MEIKVLYMVDDTRQYYTCTGCQQTIEVIGTILNMYTSPAAPFGRQRNWAPVARGSLRDVR
jgi:hypothetical protein